MNKTKTLKMKLIYIVAAVAMLAMLIPAMAVPVGAQPDYTVILDTMGGDPDGGYESVPVEGEFTDNWVGYNVSGMPVTATLVDSTGTPVAADSWAIYPGLAYIDGASEDVSSVLVRPLTGAVQVSIEATLGSETYVATKKWTDEFVTDFSAYDGRTLVSWNESAMEYYGTVSITDTVTGDFPMNPDHAVQGVLLNWYLFDSHTVINLPAGLEATDYLDYLDDLQTTGAAEYVEFIDPTVPGFDPWDDTPPYPGWLGTTLQTVTDATGACTVQLGAWESESVTIVVIPQYPNNLERPVTPEINTWQFEKMMQSSVPQVRWVGEKVVIEKYFGEENYMMPVTFEIQTGKEGSTLEPMYAEDEFDNDTVMTAVDEHGLASVILWSTMPQQVVVVANAAGYINAAFNVYFLKFESITLSDVVGKRSGHDSGVWTQISDEEVTYYNPYNKYFDYFDAGKYTVGSAAGLPADGRFDALDPVDPMPYDDVLVQTKNVSEDALERVQVRGWFMGINQSLRPESYQDVHNADYTAIDQELQNPQSDYVYDYEISLPKGRWVLPDDWAALASLQSDSIHWDIMDQPDDSVYINYPYPPSPIVGPFAPGLEVATETGWVYPAVTSKDPERPFKTVVPNGQLNAWDAPMPPAKIYYWLLPDENGILTDLGKLEVAAGYFKEAMKADIYITGVNGLYTNAFYYTLIPAHQAIPMGGGQNEGLYRWDSFDPAKGPYEFWHIVEKGYNPANHETTANYNPNYPQKVAVYSDNHGEAMVYLNGDYNLYLHEKDGFIGGDDGVHIQAGTDIASTKVQAMAVYPYENISIEAAVRSNIVTKTWTWGGRVLGVDAKTFYVGDEAVRSTSSVNVLAVGDYDVTVEDGDDSRGTSDKHMAFVWACDRDGKVEGVVGTRVDWLINNATFSVSVPGAAISQFNDVTQGITLGSNGFLSGTDGVLDAGSARTIGYSFMRATQNKWERILLYKNLKAWNMEELYNDPTGESACNFAVAGIEVYSSQAADITVNAWFTGTDFGYTQKAISSGGYSAYNRPEGTVYYTINIPFSWVDADRTTLLVDYPLDDPILLGDANGDGIVSILDVTAIERIILGLDNPDINADANANGTIDMGDVVKVMRILRGLP